MRIRLATEADLPKLKALVRWSSEELEQFDVPRMDDLVFGMLQYGVNSGDAVAVAVDQDGDIVAWCARVQLPNLPAGYAEGVGLWVHPKMRRERIGTDLRNFADEHAKRLGAEFASCVVAKDNVPGIKSCLKQGYEVVAYQMRRRL